VNRLRVATIAIVMSILFGLLPMPGADGASAATCTVTTHTRYFYFYTTPNFDGQQRWFKVRLIGQGCYDGVHAYGQGVNTGVVSKSGLGNWPALTSGPGYYKMADGRIDFWANWRQVDNFYDTFGYPRLKLSPSGAWSTSGTSVTCSFGPLSGGSCFWVVTTT